MSEFFTRKQNQFQFDVTKAQYVVVLVYFCRCCFSSFRWNAWTGHGFALHTRCSVLHRRSSLQLLLLSGFPRNRVHSPQAGRVTSHLHRCLFYLQVFYEDICKIWIEGSGVSISYESVTQQALRMDEYCHSLTERSHADLRSGHAVIGKQSGWCDAVKPQNHPRHDLFSKNRMA